TSIAAQADESWSIDYAWVEQVDTQANDDLIDFPNTPGGGGGGGDSLWGFDLTPKTSFFSGVAGKYYISDGGTLDLPSSPSPGDVVGVTNVSQFGSSINERFGSGPKINGGAGNGFGWNVGDGDTINYVGLVYVNATLEWVIFMGAVVTISS
ncbi:MAG: hypothetical protein LC650_05305, partial [Actinobacteria bacterium]|nr:hypothetical protein [Actinomycetota bacterium]